MSGKCWAIMCSHNFIPDAKRKAPEDEKGDESAGGEAAESEEAPEGETGGAFGFWERGILNDGECGGFH